MKRLIVNSIPNFITLLNMLCGVIAIIMIFEEELWIGALFVGLGAIFDFMDGMMARLLNAKSKIGGELDSLSDMVSFGVVPGLIVFKMLSDPTMCPYVRYIGLILPLFSGLRLAKFNIDTRQTESFLGLPTPASAMFFCSFPLIMEFQPNSFMMSFVGSEYWVGGAVVLISLLMVSELPLFSLKLKGFSFKNNMLQYLFSGAAIVGLLTVGVSVLPLLVVGYVLVSIIVNKSLCRK